MSIFRRVRRRILFWTNLALRFDFNQFIIRQQSGFLVILTRLSANHCALRTISMFFTRGSVETVSIQIVTHDKGQVSKEGGKEEEEEKETGHHEW